jgi:hypothetical protein
MEDALDNYAMGKVSFPSISACACLLGCTLRFFLCGNDKMGKPLPPGTLREKTPFPLHVPVDWTCVIGVFMG